MYQHWSEFNYCKTEVKLNISSAKDFSKPIAEHSRRGGGGGGGECYTLSQLGICEETAVETLSFHNSLKLFEQSHSTYTHIHTHRVFSRHTMIRNS